ncbi:PaaI family thioesterase [Natrinema gelatinilyticum]|uniref:PaaI family thioesterase n=1 Tax=Natrinema gelatinilyticum TaxID=2961571 RepID=UPI0021159C3F|nr:PaaI family thioesterase [Natrinema gelatinilyticum]
MTRSEGLPFIDLLGIELTKMSDGRAQGYLEMREDLSWNTDELMAHSGVTFTLAEVTGAAAVVSVNDPPVFTVDMDVKFLNVGYGDLYSEAEVVRDGDDISIVQIDIVDENQSNVINATAVLKLT